MTYLSNMSYISSDPNHPNHQRPQCLACPKDAAHFYIRLEKIQPNPMLYAYCDEHYQYIIYAALKAHNEVSLQEFLTAQILYS